MKTPPILSGWTVPSSQPMLTPDAVHVWRAFLDLSPEVLHRCSLTLTPDERSRASRMRAERGRDRFIAARGVLRTLLAGYLHIPPDCVSLAYGPGGKPELAGSAADSRIAFNLSHSQGMALYALSLGRRIGIDVEYVDEARPFLQIADRFFSSRESAHLRALPPGEQETAFYRCWTRKEAILKATGSGLSGGLARWEMPLRPIPDAFLLATEGGPDGGTIWSIRDLDPGSGYVGALAATPEPFSLALFGWPPSCRREPAAAATGPVQTHS